jgi:hypothetical protein
MNVHEAGKLVDPASDSAYVSEDGFREDALPINDVASTTSLPSQETGLLERVESHSSSWSEKTNGTKAEASGAEGESADPETQSHEVPAYLFPALVPMKFVGEGGTYTFALMDRVSFAVPTYVVYFYPVVSFVILWCFWGCCCHRQSREGMPCRVVCEAGMCFMCLWADLASKYRVLSKRRAWFYVIVFAGLLTLWNAGGYLIESKIMPFANMTQLQLNHCFAPIMTFVWMAYAIERMFVRKYFRRLVDRMSGNPYCADCFVGCMCPQYSVLQEAQFLAENATDDADKSLMRGSATPKW